MVTDQWDDLLLRVADSQDAVLFSEAVKCVRASASRAAYVVIWLSCAESLKRKFREASKYDNAAGKIVGQIEDRESKQQAIDSFLLEHAKGYGFITEAEFEQLILIYKLRCVYGHPYEQAPLPEQLVAAAAVAVEYVLSRPTRLRNGYLSRQVDLICEDKTFLDDHPEPIDEYAELVFSKSARDLHLWFLQKFWEQSGPILEDPFLDQLGRRVVVFSRSFLSRCDDQFYTNWDTVNDLTRWPHLSSLIAEPSIFRRISTHAQDIVVAKELEGAPTSPKRLKEVEKLCISNSVTDRQRDMFLGFVRDAGLGVLAASGIALKSFADRLLEQLESHTWPTQIEAANALATVGPMQIVKLPSELQTELGNNVLQAAQGNAFTAKSLLNLIAQSDAIWPAAFVQGVISECVVNDDGQYRFKTRCCSAAFRCINAAPETSRVAIVRSVTDRLATATPKDDWRLEGEKEIILQVLDELIGDEEDDFKVLTPLRNAISPLQVTEAT